MQEQSIYELSKYSYNRAKLLVRTMIQRESGTEPDAQRLNHRHAEQ